MLHNENYLVHNGVFIKQGKFSVPYNNRAFQYGDSLFETILAVNSELPFFKDHYARLIAGMKTLKYTVPPAFTMQYLKELILKLLRKNKLFKTARIRLQMYRAPGGLYTPESNAAEYIITCREASTDQLKINSEGLNIKAYTDIRKPVNALSSYKTGSALLYILASEYKKQTGADDVLLLNTEGHVAESTSSNIFVVKKHQIFTPPLSEGCTDGVMRRAIMSIALEEKIMIRELPLRLQDVMRSDEVFLTNAVNGIRWVVALDEKRYYSKMSKYLSKQLNERLPNYSQDSPEN
jgi:branched-chain amino acid aminotransferase